MAGKCQLKCFGSPLIKEVDGECVDPSPCPPLEGGTNIRKKSGNMSECVQECDNPLHVVSAGGNKCEPCLEVRNGHNGPSADGKSCELTCFAPYDNKNGACVNNVECPKIENGWTTKNKFDECAIPHCNPGYYYSLGNNKCTQLPQTEEKCKELNRTDIQWNSYDNACMLYCPGLINGASTLATDGRCECTSVTCPEVCPTTVRNGVVDTSHGDCWIKCDDGLYPDDDNKRCVCGNGKVLDKSGKKCVEPPQIRNPTPAAGKGFKDQFIEQNLEKSISAAQRSYVSAKASGDSSLMDFYSFHLDSFLKLKSGVYSLGVDKTADQLRTRMRHTDAGMCTDKVRNKDPFKQSDVHCKQIMAYTIGILDEKGEGVRYPGQRVTAAYDWFNYYAIPDVYHHCKRLQIPEKTSDDVHNICTKEIVAGDVFAFIKSVEEGAPKSQFLNGEGCCDDRCTRIYLKGENKEEVCKPRGVDVTRVP